MKLGAFSISLSVADLNKSKEFYEALGFSVFGGQLEHNYLIMKNGDSIVGLFQGMFEKNMLTFNPGWDQECKTVDGFDDVRAIYKKLKERGESISAVALDSESGPGSFIVTDPDGNPVLIDQHV